jgi:hypothetical protein
MEFIAGPVPVEVVAAVRVVPDASEVSEAMEAQAGPDVREAAAAAAAAAALVLTMRLVAAAARVVPLRQGAPRDPVEAAARPAALAVGAALAAAAAGPRLAESADVVDLAALPIIADEAHP